LSDYVRDRAAAIRLGKALFWDMNVGSDGNTGLRQLPLPGRRRQPHHQPDQPGQANVDPAIRAFFNKPFVAAGIPGDVPAYG
jgi:hypothetical protein